MRDYHDRYSFDLTGNRLSKTTDWDLDGDSGNGFDGFNDLETTSAYDANDRLRHEVKIEHVEVGPEMVTATLYDGRGYRTVRKTYTSGTLSETRHFYYTENWQCVEERLGTSPSTADPDRQFLWGIRYIDDLIFRDRSVSGILDERLYALQDSNWNVTTLSSTTGSVAQRYGYDSYGVPLILQGNRI